MHVAKKQRESPPQVTSVAARRVSREPAPLAPIGELEKGQKLLYKTPAKSRSDAGVASDTTATTVSVESFASGILTASKKKRRRRSYISPSSNVPSLAGGAQRVLTPTRLLEQESGDDGGMDGDTEGATPEFVSGPRRVSVLARQWKSDEGAEVVTPYKAPHEESEKEEPNMSSRETISLGSIGAALRVPHTALKKESDIKSDASPELQKFLVKEELQQTLSVRSNLDDGASTKVESPRLERKLGFPDRVPLDPAQQPTRTNIELKASRKSISSRTSLDNSKPAQSLSERLAGNPKWEMDDFLVVKNLGQGKFGNVYLAKEKCINVSVALKVSMHKDFAHCCQVHC